MTPLGIRFWISVTRLHLASWIPTALTAGMSRSCLLVVTRTQNKRVMSKQILGNGRVREDIIFRSHVFDQTFNDVDEDILQIFITEFVNKRR
jgi:hypothetical protein